MYLWLKFLHILGALVFFYSHGASGLVALQLRSERDPGRIRAMMGTYATNLTFGMQYGSLLLLLVTGIISGFIGHWWSRAWIWLAFILLIGIIVAMYMIGTRNYSQVRKSIGMEYMEAGKTQPPLPPASSEAIDGLLSRSPVMLLFAIGYGGLAIILWLMVFKPL